jgi:hypothetical protein
MAGELDFVSVDVVDSEGTARDLSPVYLWKDHRTP